MVNNHRDQWARAILVTLTLYAVALLLIVAAILTFVALSR
jgi:hypothetical protein